MGSKVHDLRQTFLKKLLIVGKTGTGKSALANRIAGQAHNASLFPVSSEAVSCTQSTCFARILFGGEKDKLINLIDTIGFDDPDNDTDVKIIAELVDKLVNHCDFVHHFIIAVNGQAPRMDGSLVAMIKIFQEMFTEAFWDRCVIVFTRVPMDKKAIKNRKKASDGKTDDERASSYIKVVEDKFPQVKGKQLKYLFLDACYDEEDEDEEEAFKTAMDQLYTMLDSHKEGLPTTRINKEVETEHGKIKRELEQREKDKEKFTKELEAVNQELKKAEENRAKDEKEYQRQVSQLEQKMKDMKTQTRRRGGGFIGDLIGAIFPPAAPIIRAVDSLDGIL